MAEESDVRPKPTLSRVVMTVSKCSCAGSFGSRPEAERGLCLGSFMEKKASRVSSSSQRRKRVPDKTGMWEGAKA